MTSTTDIIDEIKADHETATKLLGRLARRPVDDRESQFCELVHFLIAHEVAEEEIVYPALKRTGSDGDRVAEARIEEQASAEKLLASMEDINPTTKAFTASLEKLDEAVREHASLEEEEVLPRLEKHLTKKERHELATRYRKAKEAAPTHPHPHAPDHFPTNLVTGTVAAVVDRVRDSLKESQTTS